MQSAWRNFFSLRGMVRNIGSYSGLALLTLVTIILSPPGYMLMRWLHGYEPGHAVRKIIWMYGRVWTWMVSLFVPFQAQTGTVADYPKPSIIVANHQSFFDAFCMGALPIWDVAFVVRAWPFKIPFYGPYMRRAEYLNSEHLSCDTFLSEAKKRLDKGTSILIFPEGTRSTKDKLGRFYSGAFKLAVETGTPIVPMCIQGTGAVLPKSNAWLRYHSIWVETLAPVFPEEFSQTGPKAHIAMRKQVKQRIGQRLQKTQQADAPSEICQENV
ncbi:MAG: lysophospholipid acyltransferase family protein [Desulfovibrio sp.]|uniref:lysophospholipid acyltransferase family protein n=1 Tax=Desulfovibrio sp. 7SRBS1 TaxID=3378064 RepID=UPI003B40BE35